MNEKLEPFHLSIEQTRDYDIERVVALEIESGLSSRGVERYKKSLEDPAEILLVAILSNFEEFKRKVIGMFSAKLVVDELHIDNIAVDEIWRGRGVAAEMLLEGLRLGYQLGARIAELEVRSANTRARSLYEHRGFVVAGERPAYYHDPLDDALIMVSDIEQSITRAQ